MDATKLTGFILIALIVSVKTNAEPYSYMMIGDSVAPLQYHSSKEKSGLIGDIVAEVFEGYRVEHIDLPWPRQIRRIKSGRAKDWVIYSTPEWVSFDARLSDTLFDWKHIAITRAGFDFDATKITNNQTFRLVLIKHFDYPNLEEWLEGHPNGRIYYTTSTRAAIAMLTLDHGDVYIGECARINHALHVTNQHLESFNIQDFSNVIKPSTVHLAMDPEIPESTFTTVNARIARLKNNGSMTSLMQQNDWTCPLPD